jgi:hypothetical protein
LLLLADGSLAWLALVEPWKGMIVGEFFLVAFFSELARMDGRSGVPLGSTDSFLHLGSGEVYNKLVILSDEQ